MMDYSSILRCAGGRLKEVLKGLENSLGELEEIRIRLNQPILIRSHNQEFFLDSTGKKTSNFLNAFYPKRNEIEQTIQLISGYSLYAFEDELRNGFITLEGGHRVGITGQAVVEGGRLKTLKNMNGLNIRISHEIKGCADKVLPLCIEKRKFCHCLLIGPPSCGKTTLLRDMVRQLSDGKRGMIEGQTIGLVDERSEIAACYRGEAQNDIGIRTDVLDSCPKAEGMMMLLRSMSPQIIAVDEIGKDEDIYAIDSVINSGAKLLCSVHGLGIEELRKKPVLSKLLDKKVFQRYLVLSNENYLGEVKAVYNENLKLLI